MQSFFPIFAAMEIELEHFEQAFEAVMMSDVVPMDTMMRYATSVPGKRLRPRLVFLSARLFGEINDITRRTALFVEMFHTATLIHDDVVDGADTRRGQASLNARCDSRSAVLAGDFLLAKALAQLSHPEDHPILEEMLKVAMLMSEGELLQSAPQGQKSLSPGQHPGSEGQRPGEDEEYYLKIIERKTARLIRACCVGGVMSVNGKSDLMGDFGLNLGLVFQMRDDILDNDDPATTALAQRLLPAYLDKALKNLDALTPYIVDKDAQNSLRDLTLFCAERNH